MHLLHLMHDVPLWVTALAVSTAAGLYSIGLMLVARTVFGVERLKLNNEVAGFKFAVVGVFYGVLLAFVVVSVWEDFHTTEAAVRNEAKAAVDLHARAVVVADVVDGASGHRASVAFVSVTAVPSQHSMSKPWNVTCEVPGPISMIVRSVGATTVLLSSGAGGQK